MTLGEILTGQRTYFPLPVAYANDRSPIIPEQLGPRPVPLTAAGVSGAATGMMGLSAVVPGFRSLQGFGAVAIGTEPINRLCWPAGQESIVAPMCADGSIMPQCGAGSCGPDNPNNHTDWPSSVEELISRITGGGSSPAPAPTDNTGMRWGFFTVAAALLGVFVVYKELKH